MPAQSRIIDLAGGEELIRKLKALGEKAQTIVGGVLYREAEAIMTESKTQCPVDVGTLRASGHVQDPVSSGGQVIVTLGYGGPAVPYAIVQHEAMNFQHTVGNAKFLEDPMLAAVTGVEERLAKGIAKGIDDATR